MFTLKGGGRVSYVVVFRIYGVQVAGNIVANNMLAIVFVPGDEPHPSDNCADTTDGVGYSLWKRKAFGCNADVCGAHKCHQQCGEQGDVEILFVLHQVNGDGPKGEDRERLVAPCKVAPDDFEALCIAEAVDKHSNGNQEQRDADEQTVTNGTLVHADEVSCNQACRTQCGVATGNRCGNDAEDCQYAPQRAQPFFGDIRATAAPEKALPVSWSTMPFS